MRRTPLLALQFVLAAAVSNTAAPAQNYLYGTGNPTWGVNIPIENGFINVANGQVHLEFSLATQPQRGSLLLNERLVYDSRIWQIIPTGSSNGFQPTNVPNSMAGWRFTAGLETGTTSYYSTEQDSNTPVSCQVHHHWLYDFYESWTVYSGFQWTDPQGTVHLFPINTQQPIAVCDSDQDHTIPADNEYAVDGSGYYAKVTNYTTMTVFDQTGNEVYPTIMDRNGNYFSKDANGNLVDTLGHTPVTITTNGNQTFYDVLTVGSQTKRYTITTGPVYVNTAFGQPQVNEYSGTLTAIQSIRLPDGTSYSFSYDSGTSPGHYGELQSITLPTGAPVSLGYATFQDSYQTMNRWISSYSGGNGQYTFAPQVQTQCSGGYNCQESTTVTDGNGNQVVYLFTLNNGAWDTQADYYNGTSSHIMSAMTWYTTGSPCNWLGCGGTQWIDKSWNQTTLVDSNQTTKTVYTYALPWQAPTKVQVWDYSTNYPSTPTKEIDYTYGYYVNGAAFVTQTNLRDSGGAIAATTVYNYDQGSVTPTSGLPNHGAAPGQRGNLTSTVSGIGNTVTTSSTYDDAGMKLSDVDGRLNQTTYTYSAQCYDAYPATVTYPITVNGQALQSKAAYDCSTGLVTSTQDMNGVVNNQSTVYSYFTNGSNIGRLQTVSFPDGGSATYSYPPATETDQSVAQTSSANVTKKSITDSFGRPYQSILVAPEGSISSEMTYDPTGRPSSVTTAHLQGSSPTDGTTHTYYDVLGRTTSTVMPDGYSVTSSYSGNSQTVTDELGHSKQYTYDVFNRLVKVMEPDANGTLAYETDYQYNALDELTQVDQWGGAYGAGSPGDRKRAFAYDSLGRMIAETIPEKQSTAAPAHLTCPGTTGATWTMCFTYDNNGNTTSTTDNAGNLLNHTYDALNRPLSETQSGGVNYIFKYDGTDGYAHTNPLGYLTYSANNNVQAGSTFSYDAVGRLTNQRSCVPSIANCQYGTSAFNVGASYDLAGNLVSIAYPDGRLVSQSLDIANRLTGVQYAKWGGTTIGTSYYVNSAFAPTGQSTSSLMGSLTGNGAGITATFNSRQNITSLVYTNSSGTLWSRQYTWDKNALNLLKEQDPNSGAKRQYLYDTLNRLTSAVDSPTGLNETYSYDPFGNMSASGSFGSPQSFNVLNQIASGYTYDANGDQNTDIFSHSLAFDSNGMLSSVASGQETYTYDAQGNRVEVADGSARTDYIYFGQTPIAMLSNGAYTDFIYAGGNLIAEVGGTQLATPVYRVTDHIGSLAGDAPSSGTLLTSPVNYAPFGQKYSGSYPDFGYAGLQWDITTATNHATNRQLSPQQGRWQSPDPYRGSYNWADPQSLNRYAYVLNNPLQFTDPTGLEPPKYDPSTCDDIAFACPPGMPVGGGTWNWFDMMQIPVVSEEWVWIYGQEVLGGDYIPAHWEFELLQGTGNMLADLLSLSPQGGESVGGGYPGAAPNSLAEFATTPIFSKQVTTAECSDPTSITPSFGHCQFQCIFSNGAVGTAFVGIGTLTKACGGITTCPDVIHTEQTSYIIGPFMFSTPLKVTYCRP